MMNEKETKMTSTKSYVIYNMNTGKIFPGSKQYNYLQVALRHADKLEALNPGVFLHAMPRVDFYKTYGAI